MPAPDRTQRQSAPAWGQQLEKSYSSASTRNASAPSRGRDSNPMVKIVGYDAPASQSGYSSGPPPRSSYGQPRASHGDYGEWLNYSNISGTLLSDILPENDRFKCVPW